MMKKINTRSRMNSIRGWILTALVAVCVIASSVMAMAATEIIPEAGQQLNVPDMYQTIELSMDDVMSILPSHMQQLLISMLHKNDIDIKWYETSIAPFQILGQLTDYLNNEGYSCVTGSVYFMNQEMNRTDTSYHPGWLTIELYGYRRGLIDAAGVIVFSNVEGKTLLLFTYGPAYCYRDIIQWLKQDH